MQFVLHLAKKVPMDEYPKEVVEELEMKLEEVTYVHTAQLDTKTLHVYIRYIDPLEEVRDDYSIDDVEMGSFKSVIKFSKYFNYVGFSA